MSHFLFAAPRSVTVCAYFLLTVCLLPLPACSGDDAPTSTLPPEDSTHTIDSGIVYLAPVTLCTIDDKRLAEISGIAPSRLRDGLYWLHNDSGGEARLFAVDTNGITLATCELLGTANRDWEDLASVTLNGTAWLYVGDIGDNDKKYATVSVSRIREPQVQANWRDSTITAAAETAVFRYPDGAHDCEALMVDPRDGGILLLEKNGTSCGVYAAAWPGAGGEAALQRIAAFRLPFEFSLWRLVTGADMHPGSRRIAVRTYTAVLEYLAPAGSTPAALFDSTAVQNISTPGLTQAEAVCYSRDGRDILTTSEGVNPPLLIIRRSD
ncbi:MAG: hypothetical protein IH600_05590 [Bacteroidetes bacterium]|nr:hypothetical protein [Bacteroidota bacterium]